MYIKNTFASTFSRLNGYFFSLPLVTRVNIAFSLFIQKLIFSPPESAASLSHRHISSEKKPLQEIQQFQKDVEKILESYKESDQSEESFLEHVVSLHKLQQYLEMSLDSSQLYEDFEEAMGNSVIPQSMEYLKEKEKKIAEYLKIFIYLK